jgi:DNA repair photolyase
MKIKIKDLNPNPYRNIKSYPVEEEKVKALMASIEQTGFWDNILARQVDGEIQIAYGHHRLEALKRLKDPEEEVDIPVKYLDDVTMVKIMANENLENWAPTPSIIDETVRTTREFLIKNPEEIEKLGFRGSTEPPGKRVISAFLGTGWSEAKVGFSLERLKMVDGEKVDQEVIDMFDTGGSARTFIETLKEEERSGKPIPKEMHQPIVEKFKGSGNSKQVLKEAVAEVIHEAPDASVPPSENIVQDIEDEICKINMAIVGLDDSILKLNSYYERLGGIPEKWEGTDMQSLLIDKLAKISGEINSFIVGYKNKPKIKKNKDPQISSSIGNKNSKPVFGTKEWAVRNVNFISGCKNNCKYCWAKEYAISRLKTKTPDTWKIEEVNFKKLKHSYRKKEGYTMFPSTHDITPENLEYSLDFINRLLVNGNHVLLVSKPHLSCIKAICEKFEGYKDKILFRFTIGSCNPEVLNFWQPDAPSFDEKFACLKYSFYQGFQTSISCEPALDTETATLVEKLLPYVTDAIWIGLPNKFIQRLKTNGHDDPETMKRADDLIKAQSDDWVCGLYAIYKDNPQIKWKDSCKKILGLDRPTESGLDI